MKLPDGLRSWLQWPTTAGVEVTPASSLRFSAVYACIRILAESVAMLPMSLYERDGAGGRQRVVADPRHRLLHDAPNPEITAYEFLELAMVHLLMHGNAYAEIERDTDGEPLWLWPLMAPNMEVQRVSGQLVYRYRHNDQVWDLPAERVWHVRGVGSNGYVGLSPLRLAAQQIGLGLAAETFGSQLFATGAVPPAVLEYPGVLTQAAKANIRSSWEERQGGLDNAMRIAVLEQGMTYRQIGIPPEDVQFLQLRRFQIEEIARIYRVPPHMLADLERATFSNIEHQGQSFVTYSLMPWLRRIEQRSNMALLRPEDQGRAYYEFTVDALQRGDLMTRTQAYATMINWGIMSPNEARQRENLNDYEAGDQYLMPLNMVPVGGTVVSGQGSVVGRQESASGESGQGSVVSEQREESNHGAEGNHRGLPLPEGAERRGFEMRSAAAEGQLKLLLAMRPAFEEAMGRVCRRQAQDVLAAARRALGERGRGDLAVWLQTFWAEHAEWMTAALLPLYRSYGEVVVEAALADVPQAVVSDQGSVGSGPTGVGVESGEWVARYLAEFVAWHVEKSQRKVEGALRQPDPLGAVEAATALWVSAWPASLAIRETIKAGNELSAQVWTANGAQEMEWHTTRSRGFEPCSHCRAMDGMRIAVGSEFKAPGLPDFRGVRTPPVHEGCQCVMRPVWADGSQLRADGSQPRSDRSQP